MLMMMRILLFNICYDFYLVVNTLFALSNGIRTQPYKVHKGSGANALTEMHQFSIKNLICYKMQHHHFDRNKKKATVPNTNLTHTISTDESV